MIPLPDDEAREMVLDTAFKAGWSVGHLAWMEGFNDVESIVEEMREGYIKSRKHYSEYGK